MGMERTVIFPSKSVPAWTGVRDLLTAHHFPAQLRMIDGELSFPDELPPENWRDLRISTSQGMVTLRREVDRVLVVTWGNADSTLVQAWNAVTWAIAEAGEGKVLSADGPTSATAFRKTAELPSSMQ